MFKFYSVGKENSERLLGKRPLLQLKTFYLLKIPSHGEMEMGKLCQSGHLAINVYCLPNHKRKVSERLVLIFTSIKSLIKEI